MPRHSDINCAFSCRHSAKPERYRCLHTVDFIRDLAKANWHFSQDDENGWIERYQTGFVDKTPDGSENRYWILRNMGQVF